jgi:hypothetical protein
MKFLNLVALKIFVKFDTNINFHQKNHQSKQRQLIIQTKNQNSCPENERLQNMNFNFFEWIRTGVKQSVLLGVTDAINAMGTPHDDKIAKEKIMSFLQQDSNEDNIKKRLSSTSTTGSRKLGRSIAEMQ